MTPVTPAELVAEALAYAEETTPEALDDDGRAHGRSLDFPGCASIQYDLATCGQWVRADVAKAALAHLAARVVAERERAEGAEARAWYLAVLVMAGRAWAESAQLFIDAWKTMDVSKDNWAAAAELRRLGAIKRAEADALYGYASRAEVSP